MQASQGNRTPAAPQSNDQQALSCHHQLPHTQAAGKIAAAEYILPARFELPLGSGGANLM